ncbi:MAG: UDP-N-acetylglucosamine--N-acetylmuramyl-(pentapeptide) pyrophosphoryl-undecaprenol N-acetylglucosamine transferase [Patescibacteria group bacterium]
MRIVFTGGGTGGHFYPIVAVAEAVRELVKERRLLEPQLFFLGPNVFDERALYDLDVQYVHTPAGKSRRYFSILNVIDLFKTAFGVLKTLWVLYQIYPDVIFSKGGYGAVPTLFAARLLKIPVIAHDSDAIPGRGTMYAATFAKRIAISYPEAMQFFSATQQKKVALTGNPIRKDATTPAKDGAKEFMELQEAVPVILILGGSQGAEFINNTVLAALPELVQRYQVVHQTGQAGFKEVSETAKVVLDKNERRYRYKVFPYFTTLALKMAAGTADLVVSRAGSGAISEIALWGIASIIVPIPDEVSRDQRLNAFAYARAGAATVLEQGNMSPSILVSEIDRLFTNPKARNDMAEAAKKFSKPDAARKLAAELLDISLDHTS